MREKVKFHGTWLEREVRRGWGRPGWAIALQVSAWPNAGMKDGEIRGRGFVKGSGLRFAAVDKGVGVRKRG